MARVYHVREPHDPPGYAKRVTADGPQEAACEFVRRLNDIAVEYPPEREVEVSPEDSYVTQVFVVELRSVPEYTARVKKGTS